MWGKNSVKMHQVGTSETVNVLGQLLSSTIQFLCVSIRQTLLQVILKRQVEISAHNFARLLQYCYANLIYGTQNRWSIRFINYHYFWTNQ